MQRSEDTLGVDNCLPPRDSIFLFPLCCAFLHTSELLKRPLPMLQMYTSVPSFIWSRWFELRPSCFRRKYLPMGPSPQLSYLFLHRDGTVWPRLCWNNWPSLSPLNAGTAGIPPHSAIKTALIIYTRKTLIMKSSLTPFGLQVNALFYRERKKQKSSDLSASWYFHHHHFRSKTSKWTLAGPKAKGTAHLYVVILTG